jgi:hypothetical protein
VITFHAIACATLTAMMQHPVKSAVVLTSLMQLSAFGDWRAIFLGGGMGIRAGATIAFSIAIAMAFAIACSFAWL